VSFTPSHMIERLFFFLRLLSGFESGSKGKEKAPESQTNGTVPQIPGECSKLYFSSIQRILTEFKFIFKTVDASIPPLPKPSSSLPVVRQGTSKKPVHNLRPVSDSDSSDSEDAGEEATLSLQKTQKATITIKQPNGSSKPVVSVTGKASNDNKGKDEKKEGKKADKKEKKEKKEKKKSKKDQIEAKVEKEAEEEDVEAKEEVKAKGKPNDDTSSSSEDDEPAQPASKKRKAPEDSEAAPDSQKKKAKPVEPAVESPAASPSPAATPNGMHKDRQKRIQNEPFRRVKAETVSFTDDRLRDNSFMAKVSVVVLFTLR
jgi:hypothetical protein